MLVWICLLLLLSAAAGVSPVPHGACPTDRDNLKACAIALLDTAPADATITASEIDAFIDAEAVDGGCLPDDTMFVDNVNSSWVLSKCDADTSGDLTEADFVHADACLNSEALYGYLCEQCYRCGWSGPIVKK